MPTGNEGELNYTWTAGTDYSGINKPTARVGVNLLPPSQDVPITRQRVLELSKLAFECIEYLEKEGLVSQEWCVFGDIIRNLHNYPYSNPSVKKGRKRATSK